MKSSMTCRRNGLWDPPSGDQWLFHANSPPRKEKETVGLTQCGPHEKLRSASRTSAASPGCTAYDHTQVHEQSSCFCSGFTNIYSESVRPFIVQSGQFDMCKGKGQSLRYFCQIESQFSPKAEGKEPIGFGKTTSATEDSPLGSEPCKVLTLGPGRTFPSPPPALDLH